MRIRTRRASDEAIRAFIADYAVKRKAKRESISFLVQEIRYGGITFLTNHSAAMDEFERLGYRLEKERNKWGALLRTYVRLEG